MSVLESLISYGETISLTDFDIKQICYGETKIISYSDLKDVDDIMTLFDEFNHFVLFYQTTSRNIGHWVCVILHREESLIELFDSYGLNDTALLNNSDTSEDYVGGTPILTHLIQKAQRTYGVKFIFNDEQLQSADFSNINTCGRYAALRARFYNLSLPKFKSMVGSDYIVTALTIMFNENIDEIITEQVEANSKATNIFRRRRNKFIKFPSRR